ncbi:MAG: TetR/AcrR family transcriptional regulator [Acidimicrobiia bacterium]|nr:TetR/AcrR family transcriptional regulator [Acidimicrobiia bacterium]
MKTAPETKTEILAAAKAALMETGYAGLSTRKVAEAAGVPLSQIHYHFGSRHNLVLALLAYENDRLIERQAGMFGSDMPLWKQWEQACDYLEDDLASGYVRLLQEMTAAGWTDGDIAKAVRTILTAWFDLLTETAAEAEQRLGGLGPFTAAEISVLAGAVFLGAEQLILLGFKEKDLPARSALRKVGAALRTLEDSR